MDLRRLPADRTAVRRYVEELWLPYHRELEATVDRHALADDVDLVAEEVAFRLDRLATDTARTWVAVDGTGDGTTDGVSTGDDPGDGAADSAAAAVDLAAGDGTLAGFVTTDVDESPPVFDRPDRLHVGDIYLSEPYRGTGLARTLVDRATRRAREAGCAELTLDVDNERAIAFYERLGFRPIRRQLVVSVDEV